MGFLVALPAIVMSLFISGFTIKYLIEENYLNLYAITIISIFIEILPIFLIYYLFLYKKEIVGNPKNVYYSVLAIGLGSSFAYSAIAAALMQSEAAFVPLMRIVTYGLIIAFMGYYMGLATFSEDTKTEKRFLLKALLIPFLISTGGSLIGNLFIFHKSILGVFFIPYYLFVLAFVNEKIKKLNEAGNKNNNNETPPEKELASDLSETN